MSKPIAQRRKCAGIMVEAMEPRTLLSVSPLADHALPHRMHIPSHLHQHPHGQQTIQNLHVKTNSFEVNPSSSTYNGSGYSPAQIRAAYGFGTLANQGAGQTIAIVDAYDDPNIASDLAVFDKQFSLPGTNTLAAGKTGSVYSFFTKINQAGGSSLPAANSSWAQEISLDVEWAHAIAPGANIVLVEASNASLNNLLAAVDTAKNYSLNGSAVSTVSMSWGAGEFSGESSYDYHFLSPSSHPITFVASAGDQGGAQEWPAESPYVVSVGGTTLNLNSDSTWKSETGWSGTGGGSSVYELKPSYQNLVTASSYRSSPDVAYDADPNTGVAVYDSLKNRGSSGWLAFGGTSAGAPQWAGLISVADSVRAVQPTPLAPLEGVSQTLPALYNITQIASTDFHDITIGSTTGGTSAGIGYDQMTGEGTPNNALNLINDLAKVT